MRSRRSRLLVAEFGCSVFSCRASIEIANCRAFWAFRSSARRRRNMTFRRGFEITRMEEILETLEFFDTFEVFEIFEPET